MVEALGRELAGKSNHAWALHVCVLTKGGAVQACGWNKDTRHAEKHALLKLPRCVGGGVDARGMTLWSMRLNRTGSFGMAMPCFQCVDLIRMAGVTDVNFTTPHGWAELKA